MMHGATRVLLGLWIAGGAHAHTLKNRDYHLEVATNGAVTVQAEGRTVELKPEFTVMFSGKDPGRHANWRNYPLAPRWAVRWSKYEQELGSLNQWLRDEAGLKVVVSANQQGERTWDYGSMKLSDLYAQGTTNPFLAGERTSLNATRASLAKDGSILWEFKEQPGFKLMVRLRLPQPHGDPEITARLMVKRPGYYSTAFTGAPGVPQDKAAVIPQVAAGTSGRQFHFLMQEVNERLPRVHVSDGHAHSVIVVDPRETPMRTTMPSTANSRFGVFIRRENRRLTPMVFAPVMGGAESLMKAGDIHLFTVRWLYKTGDWRDIYRYIARDIYGFRDMRDNSGPGPLNEAIYNVLDFLMDRHGGNHAMWHAEQKYYNYWQDKSGIFKPFSPLFGLSAAIVLDDKEFYRRRALPVVEFALSRTNNIFSPYDVEDTGQVRSKNRGLGGPYVTEPQLVSLWNLYQHRTHAFRHYAEQSGFGPRMMEQLAAHQLTQKAEHLTNAVRVAERAMRGITGDYVDFIEMYEATGDDRFLKAAADRAYIRASIGVNLFPPVPDTTMTYDAGGTAPIHVHSFGRHKRWGWPVPKGIPVPEQTAPAWRGSEIGLETFSHHRAELWMNHHPQFMRIAARADDAFLRDLARWGMVGRYANYPGDNRTERSLVIEAPDVAERPIWELTHTSFNPGHAWEVLGALVDFLVVDCLDRSRGAISFPAETMSGSAFRVNAYGGRPGRFYDDENVRLWVPRDLMQINNKQIDYLAGHGNGKIYVAFWNQSFTEESVEVTFSAERASFAPEASVRAWKDNQEIPSPALAGNRLRFTVPPKGLYAVAISGASAHTTLQARMQDPASPILGPDSLAAITAPFGRVHGLILSMGRGLTSAFVYTDALPENVISARLRHRQGNGTWQELTDEVFPYEFTVWLDEDQGPFECMLDIEGIDGKWTSSPVMTLRHNDM